MYLLIELAPGRSLILEIPGEASLQIHMTQRLANSSGFALHIEHGNPERLSIPRFRNPNSPGCTLYTYIVHFNCGV